MRNANRSTSCKIESKAKKNEFRTPYKAEEEANEFHTPSEISHGMRNLPV